MPRVLQPIRRLVDRWSGVPVDEDLAPFAERLETIESHERVFRPQADDRLREASERLRSRAGDGAHLDDLLPEAFGLVRETCRRTLAMRPFDVQVVAGIALHEERIVEMATGEGKTLAAVAPACLRALTGLGVHVLTFNDYLARRDAGWMGPAYRLLGLTVDSVGQGKTPEQRRTAYRCDVTYVTAKEAGFDDLRDQAAIEVETVVHRPFHFAIVDEADSILVDEARVPLLLAGGTGEAESLPVRLDRAVRDLREGEHWIADEERRNVTLTGPGLDRMESLLACGSLVDGENVGILSRIHCALHAREFLHRDVDYIVRDGRIRFVDEFTGRVVEDRHWPAGLQAALEAKEGLIVRPDSRVLGSTTLQHFVRQYRGLCGMTATARTAARELHDVYGRRTLVVPPNRPCIREDHPDVVFADRVAKDRAVTAEIRQVHETGRPVLVGTASVEESERFAAALEEAGISCAVLNAKNDEEEAGIVAEAGSVSAVTISTNMAGRGTDIRLGGADERDRERVVALGGLYVLGTNRHESSRIDDQLRGRAGRQGDPGASRFFVCLEDPLFVRNGIRHRVPGSVLRVAGENGALDHRLVRREIDHAQRVVDGRNIEMRRTLYRYSGLVEEQRRSVQARRREIRSGRYESRVSRESPAVWAALENEVGAAAVKDAERRITLHWIDREWSGHLGRLTDAREGIHLARIGGRDPLAEFHSFAGGSFASLQDRIDRGILGTFESLEVREGRLDLAGAGIEVPGSTWTYMISDDPFRDHPALILGGNIGFAAAAALFTGPLLIAWALLERLFRRRRERER